MQPIKTASTTQTIHFSHGFGGLRLQQPEIGMVASIKPVAGFARAARNKRRGWQLAKKPLRQRAGKSGYRHQAETGQGQFYR